MIIIQKHKFYGNIAEMNQLQMLLTETLILMQLMLLLIHLKIKEKITGQRHNNGTKNVKIMVPSKYLSNFWGTLEMCLINWEINLDLNWSKNCYRGLNWKSQSRRRCNNAFYYQRKSRKNFTFFTRNHKSIVNVVVRLCLFYSLFLL